MSTPEGPGEGDGQDPPAPSATGGPSAAHRAGRDPEEMVQRAAQAGRGPVGVPRETLAAVARAISANPTWMAQASKMTEDVTAFARAASASPTWMAQASKMTEGVTAVARAASANPRWSVQAWERTGVHAAAVQGFSADRAAVEQARTAISWVPSELPHQSVAGQLVQLANVARPDVAFSKSAFDNIVGNSFRSQLTQGLAQLAAQVTAGPKVPLPAALFVDQMKVLDAMTGATSRHTQLTATVDAARLLFNDSALETWRTSLLAADTASRLAGMQRSVLPAGVLEQLTVSSQLTADLAARLAEADDSGRVLLFGTARVARTWQGYLARESTPDRLRMAATAGTGVAGLIGADLLRLPAERITDDDVDEVDELLVTPWHQGRAVAHDELYELLRGINPDVVGFLQGGWDDVTRNGAMAASKIAHCAVEALHHTLRTLAPEAELLSWIHAGGRPKPGYLDEKGKPTRRARTAYALRDRPDDAGLVQGQIDAVSKQVAGVLGQAQGIKHAPGRSTVMRARTVLVTVEAVLMQLVGY